MPEVSCKTVVMQNYSQWPCSMCPILHFRLVGVRTSYIHTHIYTHIYVCIIHIFLDTLSSGPHYKALFGGPLAAPCYSLTKISLDLNWVCLLSFYTYDNIPLEYQNNFLLSDPSNLNHCTRTETTNLLIVTVTTLINC